MTTITRQPIISAEIANELADLFAATPCKYGTLGLSPYGSDGEWCPLDENGKMVPSLLYKGRAHTEEVRTWWNIPAIAERVAGLPQFWEGDVYDVQNARAAAIRDAARRANYEAVEHPGIRAYLLDHFAERGMRETGPADLSSMTRLAAADHSRPIDQISRETGKPIRIGKGPYQPEPGCKAKLHLRQAICYKTTQESYADHAWYAIPATIEEGSDLAVCRRNLGRFAAALRTTNGLAGFGSSWEFALIEQPEGVFAIATSRSSIAD